MITVRLDAFFHADLLAEANRLQISLNTLALMKLAIPLEPNDDLPLDI
jgi:predicted HicB family RNase H-like nuclease